MKSVSDLLITICARGGSRGFPHKNIREIRGAPLISHTIRQAREWFPQAQLCVSTDSEAIAHIARQEGVEVPFLRPDELATDTAPKLPVVRHALTSWEARLKKSFSQVLDLDPTSPLRTQVEVMRAFEQREKTGADVVFSVVPARKNPYFNMVERNAQGQIVRSKALPGTISRRQDAPKVWDMNASVYLFSREFLISKHESFWDAHCEIIEMSELSAFDIDLERDFVVMDALWPFWLERHSLSK
jgi:CMP-N,N'-diacetyllegionaminic acid synthase